MVEASLDGPRHEGLAFGERWTRASVVPVPHVGREPRQPVEHELLAVAVQHGQARVLTHGFEDATVVGLPEAGVVLVRVKGLARRLDGVEDALGTLAEAGLHEGEDGLGDRDQRVLDEARVLLEIVVQAVPGELARQRERAEDRRDDGAVGAPVHHAAEDRFDVGRPPGGLHGHGADLLPVCGSVDGVAQAGAVAVRGQLVALDAAPILHGITAGGRDLEEVGAVPLVEA